MILRPKIFEKQNVMEKIQRISQMFDKILGNEYSKDRSTSI